MTSAGIFQSIFYFRYSVVKTQSSIFYHLDNSYFISIVTVLYLIHYPLEKHFKKGYIFSVFSSGIAFSSNLVGFESQKFYRLSWATMGVLQVSLTKVNSNYKTETSKQKQW